MAHLLGLTILLAFAAGCILVVATLTLIYRWTYPPRQTYASALARKLPTNPADIGLTYVDAEVTFADGSTTPAWVIEGRGPADTAMVIAHGFGDSRYAALVRAYWLKHRAAKLVVYDLRAHGEATAKRFGFGTIEADDLIELIRQLDLPEQLVLYGYSIGGSIAITAAARAPTEVGRRIKAVVADGAVNFPLEPLVAVHRRQRYPVFPFVYLAWGYIAWTLRKYRPLDRAAHAADLPCPLLALHGSDDWLCPLTSARRIVAAAPRGELIVFEGGDHFGLREHDRRRYVKTVARFLKACDNIRARNCSDPAPRA